MYRVTFVSSLFSPDGLDRAASHETLQLLLDTLTEVNTIIMRRVLMPALYAAGVRYQAEPRGVEDWLDCLQVCRRKYADCEDLAAYRAAELRRRGVQARAVFRFWQDRRTLEQKYHCLVRYAASYGKQHPSAVLVGDEYEEDPSKVLGMEGAY